MLEKGKKFIIDETTCQDTDVLEWYKSQADSVLVADHVEVDTNGVWVEGCDFRIDLDDILEVEEDGKFWYAGWKFADTYWTPYTDYKDKIGKKFEVLRRMTKDEVDEECLPLWRIKFEDGEEITAYPEEIIEKEVNRIKATL